MKKILAISLACLMLVGCGKPLKTESTNNADIQVNTLFTKDGCTAYTFLYAGDRVYYIVCEGNKSAMTSREYMEGKVIHRQEVQTVNR